MQVYLSKQNSRKTTSNNMSTLSLAIGVVIISASLITVLKIPGYGSFFTGLLLILATIRFLYYRINKKPLLLEISSDQINYISEGEKELVTINNEDIITIHHKFCELEIYTKDERVHNINLLNSGSEQTRWEIKEQLKKLTKEIKAANRPSIS